MRSKRNGRKRKGVSMIGTYAGNFHEGSRSEILADYVFTAWGTVSPVRRQDDHGLDLYCTLAEMKGRRAVVRQYFVVQVKSDDKPWILEHSESVKWLVEYPSPLFLAVVDKKDLLVRIYHLMPRFGLLGLLPARLELKPEITNEGETPKWLNAESVSLSAPIVQVTMKDLMDKSRMKELQGVFAHWVAYERENCDLMRQGLLRFRMPYKYSTNELPGSWIEIGASRVDGKFLGRGILALAESAECIGGQLGTSGDLAVALRAALLVRQLQKTHPQLFSQHPRWRNGFPGDLGGLVFEGLRILLNSDRNPPYFFEGIEAVEKALESDDLVKRFLQGESVTTHE
jgi:hypothetical protein